MFRFGAKKRRQSYPKRNHTLIILYALINVVCLFSGFITGTGWKSTLVYLLLNMEFYIILSSLFDDYKSHFSLRESYYLLTRGYLALVLMSLIGCVVMFLYIKAGGNPDQNPIEAKYDLFYDNAFNFGAAYRFPLHLCVVDVSPDIRIPFFQESGLIEGLYHEPHCMTFMLFPALFLFLYYSKNIVIRVIWILLFLFIVLLTGSTTNIAAILASIVVYMFYTFKRSITRSVVLLITLALIASFVYIFVDLTAFEFIFNKIEGGSKDYSASTIGFALHPRTLWGTSFYNLSYVNSSSAAQSMDIGFINFILNGLFLILCFTKMLKLFRKDNPIALTILLSSVYFFAHSAKVAMVAYSLTMLIFIVFLLDETARTPEQKLATE